MKLMYFDPVPLDKVRKGDTLLVPTSPGFVTVECMDVRREDNGSVSIDIARNAYTDDENRTNSAWVEFRQTGNALVLRPLHFGRGTVGDFRRNSKGV